MALSHCVTLRNEFKCQNALLHMHSHNSPRQRLLTVQQFNNHLFQFDMNKPLTFNSQPQRFDSQLKLYLGTGLEVNGLPVSNLQDSNLFVHEDKISHDDKSSICTANLLQCL